MQNSTAFAPPLSGVVLGHVIEAFDLRTFDKPPVQGDTTPVLSGRNASRFFAGERISPEAENEIWQATAAALIEADPFPDPFSIASVAAVLDPRTKDSPAIAPVVVLTRALTVLGKHWDNTAGGLRRLTAPVAFPRHAAGACLRLVVVDVCVRLTGLLWLTQRQREIPLPRMWADPKGVSMWLRQLLDQCSLSREGLATEMKVTKNTIDRWLDHEARPTDENLQDIADHFSRRGMGDRLDVLRQLRLTYSMHALFKVIEGAIGAEQAEALASRIVDIPVLLLEVPRRSQKPSECDFKMRLAMTFGTLGRGELALPQIEALLKPWWRGERDPVWATSIKAATRSWFEYLQYVTAKLGPSGTEAEWAAVGIPMPSPGDLDRSAYWQQATKRESARDPLFAVGMEVAQGGKFGALELKLQALDLACEHDFAGAVRLLRHAAEQDPLNAEIHYRLGACCWQSGDIAGGLTELEIAVQLDPGWDRPPVEISIVLGNTGRDDEALRRLEATGPLLRERSPWYLLHVAFANERAGHLDRAVEVYEELLSVEPDNGEALDRVAHLRFLQGDKRRGAALAKRAAHLGFTDVFDAWEAAYYDGKLSDRRPPRTTPEHLRHFERR